MTILSIEEYGRSLSRTHDGESLPVPSDVLAIQEIEVGDVSMASLQFNDDTWVIVVTASRSVRFDIGATPVAVNDETCRRLWARERRPFIVSKGEKIAAILTGDDDAEAIKAAAPLLLTATIADGQYASDAVALDGRLLGGFHLPAGFEGGNLQFERSTDGATWRPVKSRLGTTAQYVAASSQFVPADINDFIACSYFRIISVDAGGNHAPQTGDAAISIELQP